MNSGGHGGALALDVRVRVLAAVAAHEYVRGGGWAHGFAEDSVGKIWNKEFDQALIKQPHIARPVRAKIVGKYDEIFRCGSERSGSAWRAFDR